MATGTDSVTSHDDVLTRCFFLRCATENKCFQSKRKGNRECDYGDHGGILFSDAL